MSARRPRCDCGDVFSDHDFSTYGEGACSGPVCQATSYRDQSDMCILYNVGHWDRYVPLDEALRYLDLDRATFKALLAENKVWLRSMKLGPLGQAAREQRKAREAEEQAAEDAEYLATHPWLAKEQA